MDGSIAEQHVNNVASPPGWPHAARRRLVTGLLTLLLLAAMAGSVALALVASARQPPILGPAPAFALVDQFERPVTSADLRGRVVVANFVYTSCPDICPTLSLQMRALQEWLRRERLLGEAQLLSFTVDPARDTPPVLRAYAERHGADPSAWRFVTGSPDEVMVVITAGFYQAVQALPTPVAGHGGHGNSEASGSAPDVLHSGRFVLIDRDWRVRAYYAGDEFDPERVVRDVRALLRR